jgi:multidrug efflux pump subunit AcrA (membrane-fusion protein)
MRRFFLYSSWLLIIVIIACHHKATTTEEEEVATENVQTPVTVTTISNETLNEYVELNATSSFLQDNIVKSNINGYIKTVNTKLHQYTPAGKILFVLKTKEAESLGNTIDKLDPSFNFSGVVSIHASQSGYVTQLDHQPGDYVQDGEQLAVISDSKSFGFVLNIPYELRKYIFLNKAVEVILPDDTHLNGTVTSFTPTIDSASQTQGALVKVAATNAIPENLVAKVRILKSSKTNASSLPKQAVLTDEAQTNFWVMRMIDSVTAVKVPVIKGVETGERVEIIRPQFTANDKILLTGNYGLPDTAKVKIVKSAE